MSNLSHLNEKEVELLRAVTATELPIFVSSSSGEGAKFLSSVIAEIGGYKQIKETYTGFHNELIAVAEKCREEFLSKTVFVLEGGIRHNKFEDLVGDHIAIKSFLKQGNLFLQISPCIDKRAVREVELSADKPLVILHDWQEGTRVPVSFNRKHQPDLGTCVKLNFEDTNGILGLKQFIKSMIQIKVALELNNNTECFKTPYVVSAYLPHLRMDIELFKLIEEITSKFEEYKIMIALFLETQPNLNYESVSKSQKTHRRREEMVESNRLQTAHKFSEVVEALQASNVPIFVSNFKRELGRLTLCDRLIDLVGSEYTYCRNISDLEESVKLNSTGDRRYITDYIFDSSSARLPNLNSYVFISETAKSSGSDFKLSVYNNESDPQEVLDNLSILTDRLKMLTGETHDILFTLDI